MRTLSFILLFSVFAAAAQFDGPGGEPGSKSISKDDGSITAWATSANIQRGKLQINQSNNARATLGDSASAIGPFDGNVVSLGDSGVATLGFDLPITNTDGYDFAVFENGFKIGLSFYLELAFVEVSADGKNFVRFPNESRNDTSAQIDNFGYVNPYGVYNLAGKHQAPYGTLFDLDEVGLESAKYVRIIDAIGSVNDSFGTRDSKGQIINDPWPTPFASCGFDLDAVAVVDGSLLSTHSKVSYLDANPLVTNTLRVNEPLRLKEEWHGSTLTCKDIKGTVVQNGNAESCTLAIAGTYIVSIQKNNKLWVQKIIVY